MKEQEAKEVLEDVQARAALWRFLWAAAHKHEKGRPTPPPPADEMVQAELKRILLPKRKKFLGLF